MDDQKYIVFKRSEFYQLMGELALPPWGHANSEMCGSEVDCAPIAEKIKRKSEELEVPDATVIRGQDLFSGPVLHQYAGEISTSLEILELLGVGELTHPAIKYLKEVREYFANRAADADGASFKKIPD